LPLIILQRQTANTVNSKSSS